MSTIMYVAKYAAPPSEKELVGIAYMQQNLKGQLLEDDVYFILDAYTMLRFLRQQEGKKEKGLALLEACIAWRRDFKPHRITFDEVEGRMRETADSHIGGLCHQGLPLLFAKPRVNRKLETIDADIKVMAWSCEEIARRGYREFVTVVDMALFDRLPDSDEQKAQEALDDLTYKYYPLLQTKIILMHMPLLLRALFVIASAVMCKAQKKTLHTGVKPKHLKEWIGEHHIPVEYNGTREVLLRPDGTMDILAMLPERLG